MDEILAPSTRDLYCRVWATARDAGVVVSYGPAVAGECALFDETRPAITLVRRQIPAPATTPSLDLDDAELETELANLAHECGHMVSYAMEWPRGYLQARHLIRLAQSNGGRPLTPEASRLVWEEEVRAWDYAELILWWFGLRDTRALCSCRAESLRYYDQLCNRRPR